MVRQAQRLALVIWANGVRVATWHQSRRGQPTREYDAAWMRSKEGRPLSLSLPTNPDGRPLRGKAVESYFDNLLPDSEPIRRRLQAKFRTPSGSAFDLLAAIGRDCVGAVQLLPDGEVPTGVTQIDVTPLTTDEVGAELAATLTTRPYSADEEDSFRISIAGAQEKTAFTWHAGQWCRPHGATPTTHIFKLPMGLIGNKRANMQSSVENEWLCAQLLLGFGLPVAHCEYQTFGDQKALIVERFDRRLHSSGDYWLRLPQEDFCQATGTPAIAKYEADGGPGLVTIAQILQNSETREVDLRTLLTAQLLFWMLAAIDGHAKNFSIHLLPGGRYRLTPLYDVISAWPVVGDGGSQYAYQKLKLAMAMRGRNTHYRLRDIHRRHFNNMAFRCGLGPDMEDIISSVIDRTPAVVAEVGARLPPKFPEGLFSVITQGMLRAADELRKESLAAGSPH
jgi:serine/threonine-protein kinase HipA